MTLYAAPGAEGAKISYQKRYDNFIGGKFVAPVKGDYFDVVTPTTGKVYTQAARSTAEDIELALDAAHAAADSWGKTPAAERSNVLLRIADRMEQNLELLAYADSVDNGKPIRETLAATFRWPSTTCVTLPVCCAARKAASAKSTPTPWLTTTTSRSAWSGRTYRGTSPS